MKRTLTAIAMLLMLAATAHAQTSAPSPAPNPTTDETDSDSQEIRRGQEMGGNPEERAKRYYERLLSKVEPSMLGDVNRLPQYLDFFAKEFVEDPRTFACSLKFDITGDDKASITGYLEFPEHQEALKNFFTHLKLPGVEDQTELLPSKDLGEKKYAVVTAAHAFIYDKPEGKRETLTECTAGDTIFLLKPVNGSFLCHGPTGYVGYIDAKNVRPVTEMAFDGLETSLAVQRGSQIETVIAAANKLMGVKYVWGASSAEGVDCSGLVLTGFKAIGVNMPRDANQQYLVGRLVATRWHRTGLRRGDTLYFLSRRGTIHHTALYLGDGKYIEAAGKQVKITSFNPKDPNYDEKRDKSFCFGKRVIE